MEIYPDLTNTILHTFTQSDFDRFAALTGDDNPIHVDPAFAARTRFGKTVAHGMFLFSHLCAGFGQFFPGFVLVEQEMMFPNPTFAGEPVTFRFTVTETDLARGRVDVQTTVIRADGEPGLQGRAGLVSPDRDQPSAGVPRLSESPASSPALGRLRLGQSASAIRTFTPVDLAEYADLTGDTAWVNANRVPGGLLGGMFSDLLGTQLPGRGTNWLKQSLRFATPAAPGDPITATVEIVRLRPDKDLVNLRTVCTAGAGVVCEGEALVYVKDLDR